jgi:hypothetical protein
MGLLAMTIERSRSWAIAGTEPPNELRSRKVGAFTDKASRNINVERTYLKGKDPEARIECCHPTYKSQRLVLEHLQYFKNHVQTVHGITLRHPRFVRSTK